MEYTGKVPSPESLGRILQQARLLNGLSQRELAERLGTTQRYIWEVEAGKPSIFTKRLFEMMRETGVDLSATIHAPRSRGDANKPSRSQASTATPRSHVRIWLRRPPAGNYRVQRR